MKKHHVIKVTHAGTGHDVEGISLEGHDNFKFTISDTSLVTAGDICIHRTISRSSPDHRTYIHNLTTDYYQTGGSFLPYKFLFASIMVLALTLYMYIFDGPIEITGFLAAILALFWACAYLGFRRNKSDENALIEAAEEARVKYAKEIDASRKRREEIARG